MLIWHCVCFFFLLPYCGKRRDIKWNIAWAQGISSGPRLYFTVYHYLNHTTDILLVAYFLMLPGWAGQIWRIFSCIVQLNFAYIRKSSPSTVICCGSSQTFTFTKTFTKKYTWSERIYCKSYFSAFHC